jgi:DNA repair exonuclease SbcCD ATPase subunit
MIDQLNDSVEVRRVEHDKKSQEIIDKLSQLREDVRTSIHTSNKELSEQIDKKIASLETDVEDLSEQIETMHRWKWFVTGGAIIVGWIISKLGLVINLL